MSTFQESDTQSLFAKLQLIWNSPELCATSLRTIEDNQFRFYSEVAPEVFVTVWGSVYHSPPNRFQWQTRDALLQWRGCELVCNEKKFSVGPGKFKQFAPVSAEPDERHAQKAFFAHWKPLFRRGCFLSGMNFQHSAREKREWMRWFHEQSGTLDNLEFESRRIAAAFNLRSFDGELGLEWSDYQGRVGAFPVKWQLGAPDGRLASLYMEPDEARTHIFQSDGVWHGYTGKQFHEQIARGLYRLGLEPEELPLQLTYDLTAHERLELRHSLPREFWPKKWKENVSVN